MGRILTGRRALRQQLKNVKRELSSVRTDIQALEKGKPVARRPDEDRSRLSASVAADYPATGLRLAGEEEKDQVESLLEAEKKMPRQPLDEGRLAQEDRAIKERAKNVRDERFSDYLASSFEAGGALRHERTIQRNKAVLLAVAVFAVLAWLIKRFVW
ncbi:MAG: hypothetical protein QGH42_11535 [Kiritimatiellia bacterium]|nr:hypothetical protein [Kiritimatiellia bacterium]MDP6810084.1 hypothetical protein [Kiritimatiellia bacterium]MDP7024855.1 hypothetical protein [Kiritimatiellia bacterium]